jgi:hypothetical protein
VIGQSTRPSAVVAQAQPADLWYMVYRDDEGTVHTVKGTTENIRKAFRDRLLGDAGNIRACRTKQGPFQPLHSYPEFRDLVIDPQLNANEPGAVRPTTTISNVLTPPIQNQPASGITGTAPYAAVGPISGRWGPGSNSRFPSPSTHPSAADGKSNGVTGKSSAVQRIVNSNTMTWIIWSAVLALATVAGIASVLLLRK